MEYIDVKNVVNISNGEYLKLSGY